MTAQPLILALETSTLSCSIALFRGEDLLDERQTRDAKHVHGKQLLPMIDEMLKSCEIPSNDLDAIAVSAGPGSYTGLRIGVSTAKGIALAHDLPLMAFDSLHVQAIGANKHGMWDAIIAVMDARRDEVYTASFVPHSGELQCTDPTRALIIDQERTASELFPVVEQVVNSRKTCIIGDAADKTERLVSVRMPDASYLTQFPHARDMHELALKAFHAKAFEDLAYYAPRYLKEFQAGKPRDPLGLRTSTAS